MTFSLLKLKFVHRSVDIPVFFLLDRNLQFIFYFGVGYPELVLSVLSKQNE